MKNIFEKIIRLSDSRISEFEDDLKKEDSRYREFYKGPKTYQDGLVDEIEEAFVELKENNSVHLEDELGDVFWDYCCLLQGLEKRGYISSVEKVFERCDKKFGERIPFVREHNYDGAWAEIKKKQKKELKEEHESIYGKSNK